MIPTWIEYPKKKKEKKKDSIPSYNPRHDRKWTVISQKINTKTFVFRNKQEKGSKLKM